MKLRTRIRSMCGTWHYLSWLTTRRKNVSSLVSTETSSQGYFSVSWPGGGCLLFSLSCSLFRWMASCYSAWWAGLTQFTRPRQRRSTSLCRLGRRAYSWPSRCLEPGTQGFYQAHSYSCASPLLLLSLQHFLWRTFIFTKRLQIWVWTSRRPLLSIDNGVKRNLHHLVPVWRIMERALICLDNHTALKGCQVQLVSFPRAETAGREDTILIKAPGTGLARWPGG